MLIEQTQVSGVLILTPRRHGDSRGFFAETYNRDILARAGLDLPALREESEWRVSLDNKGLTLRVQAPPRARGQLLRCGRGAVRVSAVDGRPGAGFGRAATVTISADDGRQVWVPAGRLVGWTALQDDSLIVSNATDYLVPELLLSVPCAGDEARIDGWTSPFAGDMA